MFKISIGTGSDETGRYRATIYNHDTDILKQDVKHYKYDICRNHINNLNLITASLNKFLGILQQENLSLKDTYLVVEIKDKTVINWVDNTQAPMKYSQEFIKFISALDQIRGAVRFIHTEEPQAKMFANSMYYKEESYQGISDLLLINDD